MRRLVALLLGLTAIDMALIAQVGYAADPPSGRTTTLQIEGMTCGACATSVKIVLGKLDGVSDAKVSFREKRAVVTYDPGKVTPEQMVEAIHAKLPYKATAPRTGRTK